MQYLYSLANASLTMRVIERLCTFPYLPVHYVTVIHRIDGWVIRVKMEHSLDCQQDGDFRAFLNELGIPCDADPRLQMVLWSLEVGQTPVEVMRRYQVAIVSHGRPGCDEIEAFRSQFVQGLGYCPETLA